jgi:hypothetical protein
VDLSSGKEAEMEPMQHVTRWSVALATCLVATSARAQEAVPAPSGGDGPIYVFEETMSAGLVPLFTAMGAGIAFMLLLALIAAGLMRHDEPHFPREA